MALDRTRTTRAFPEDKLRTHLNRLMTSDPASSVGWPFQFVQVIETEEKRIKVRIPLLDDVLEDDELPWCVPITDRLYDIPDVNTAGVIGIWNPKEPSVRFWLGSIPEFAAKDLFDGDSINEDFSKNKEVWNNISDTLNKTFGQFPGDKGRDLYKAKAKKINYKVGLRGKGKNYLLFEKDKTTLIQNKGLKTESKLVLTDKAELLAQNLDLLSTLSRQTQRPVFANPLFNFMQQQLILLQLIVTVLTTTPAFIYGVIPCTPSPTAMPLVGQMAQLMTKFGQLRVPGNGSSQYIKIN